MKFFGLLRHPALFGFAVAATFALFFLLGTTVSSAVASSGGLAVASKEKKKRVVAKKKRRTRAARGVFPVRARVTWGDGLGAGRGHQGQDLMARCGRKIVASKPGRVRYVDYQASGAGNYAVIRGTNSKFDYVYMHMIRRPRVKRGQFVRAGQVLGRVGSTGRSSACHLHFEMWTRPGWYRGGSVKSPTGHLRKWQRARRR